MARLTPLTWITSAIAVYHLIIVGQLPTWLGWFLPNQIHLAVSALCALTLIFTLRRAGQRHDAPHDAEKVDGPVAVPWYDWLLIAAAAASAGFIILDFEAILDYGMFGALDAKGMFFALCLAIPLLEGIRRTTGWALPVIIVLFVAGTMFQQYLPGLLYGNGFPLERLLYSSYVGESGIFGLPLNVAANIVIVFLIFGAALGGAVERTRARFTAKS